MKKKLLLTILLALGMTALAGCSMTGEPEPTIAPVEKPAEVISVFDEYAILAGHTLYTSPDAAYSIQLPEGATIDDSNPDSITVTIAGEFEMADIVNITFTETATVIDTEAKLMDMLRNDNSIDITGFFLLKNNGAYEGYKYTYTSVDDTELKGIKSTYFSKDGSAYVVTATLNNGGDSITETNINTIVDTFINYR